MLSRSKGWPIWPPRGASVLPGVVYGIAARWGWPSASQIVRVAADVIIVKIAGALRLVLYFYMCLDDAA